MKWLKILHEVGRGFSHLSWARGVFYVKIVCFIAAFITLNFATEPIGNNRCKHGLRLFVIYEQSQQSSATAVCQLFGENRPPQFTPSCGCVLLEFNRDSTKQWV